MGAPVRCLTFMLARKWLRLVSTMRSTPAAAISASTSSGISTGSTHRFPPARRSRYPLKSYPWRSENQGQVRIPGRISRMPAA